MESFKSPSLILYSIIKLNGGSSKFTDEETDRLVKSILSKSKNSSVEEISFNKFSKKILNGLEPVLTNKHLWRILVGLEKP